jgi:hypothetical protein
VYEQPPNDKVEYGLLEKEPKDHTPMITIHFMHYKFL